MTEELNLVSRARSAGTSATDKHLAQASRHIADFIGVYLAGCRTAEMRTVLELLRSEQAIERANLKQADSLVVDPLLPERANALFLGAAGHFHDYDDDEPAVLVGHPTVVIASAVLSVGAAQNATTRQCLAAFISGVEAAMAIGACVNPGHYNKGWHATATLGVFGAAVAAGILKGLSDEQIVDALNFAASQSAGIKAGFGSSAKPLQVGLAAANGVWSSNLAASGMKATRGMVFGPAGFFAMNEANGVVTRAIAKVGTVSAFDDPGINIKLYPCCSSSHTAIDGLLESMQEHDLQAQDIDKIELSIGPDIPAILMFDIPKSPLEGKFSAHYPVAVAWQTGSVTLEDFVQKRIDDSELADFMRRIAVKTDPSLPRSPNGVTHASRVVLKLKNGKSISRVTEHPRGSTARPLSDEKLAEKFERCSSPILGSSWKAAFERLVGMPEARPISALLQSMRSH